MKVRIVSIILLLFLVSVLVACSAGQRQEPDKAEPTRTPEPMIVKEWTGIGNKVTEPFIIDSDVWAISWSFVPEPIVGIYANLLMIDIGKPNRSLYTSSPISITNVKQPVSDYSYIYEKGTYYLDITSMSGEWSIKVIAYE